MPQNNSDIELLDVVVSDIDFLRNEFTSTVDDHSLRRNSPILRRLLVSGDFHRAWKILGLPGQAIIKAPSIDPLIKLFTLDQIEYATAGGANSPMGVITGVIILKRALSPNEVAKLNNPPHMKEYEILKFVESACAIVRGEKVKRRVLINYVCNKLGGAHFDPKRKNKKNEKIYSLLDDVAWRLELVDKPAIYYELLSMGQSLLMSEDLARFSSRAEEFINK
jgi:hypothetical protein